MFLHHVRSGVVFMGRHSIGQNAMLPIPISTIDILTKKRQKIHHDNQDASFGFVRKENTRDGDMKPALHENRESDGELTRECSGVRAASVPCSCGFMKALGLARPCREQHASSWDGQSCNTGARFMKAWAGNGRLPVSI